MITGLMIGMFVAGMGTLIASLARPLRLPNGMVVPQKWGQLIGILVLAPWPATFLIGFAAGRLVRFFGGQADADILASMIFVDVVGILYCAVCALLVTMLAPKQAPAEDEDADKGPRRPSDDEKDDERQRREEELKAQASPPAAEVPAGPVKVTCKHCSKVLKIQPTALGKAVKCPACKKVFTAPAPPPNAPAAVSSPIVKTKTKDRQSKRAPEEIDERRLARARFLESRPPRLLIWAIRITAAVLYFGVFIYVAVKVDEQHGGGIPNRKHEDIVLDGDSVDIHIVDNNAVTKEVKVVKGQMAGSSSSMGGGLSIMLDPKENIIRIVASRDVKPEERTIDVPAAGKFKGAKLQVTIRNKLWVEPKKDDDLVLETNSIEIRLVGNKNADKIVAATSGKVARVEEVDSIRGFISQDRTQVRVEAFASPKLVDGTYTLKVHGMNGNRVELKVRIVRE